MTEYGTGNLCVNKVALSVSQEVSCQSVIGVSSRCFGFAASPHCVGEKPKPLETFNSAPTLKVFILNGSLKKELELPTYLRVELSATFY